MPDNTQTVTVQLNLYGEARQVDGQIFRSSSKVRQTDSSKKVMTALSGDIIIVPDGPSAYLVLKVNNEHRQPLQVELTVTEPESSPVSYQTSTLLLRGILVLPCLNLHQITILNPIVTGDESYTIHYSVSTTAE